jgi:hypothetical protein
MMVHACNPSTHEAEAGESRVQGQPALHSKTLTQNKTKNGVFSYCQKLIESYFEVQ